MSLAGGLFVLHCDTDATQIKEVLYDVSDVGVRWALQLGLQRFEFTIEASSIYDAYQRYQNDEGDRFTLMDHFCDRPIADGWCYEVMPPQKRTVTYIIANKRHEDEFETDNPTSTDDTDVYIKSVLSNHVPSVSSDQSNIEPTGLPIGEAYSVDPVTGTKPLQIIRELVNLGDSAGNVLNYYLVNPPLVGGLPQLPLPYLIAPDTTTNTTLQNWQVDLSDLSSYGFARHIWDLANEVTVYYTATTTLTANAASGATALTVASIAGFADNDEITIVLDSGTTQRTTINGTPAGVTINIDDPLTNAASIGNLISKQAPTPTTTATDVGSQSDYWTREFKNVQTKLNQTQANVFRDLTLSTQKDPVQQTSFAIGAGKVKDSLGAVYPVWRMLINPFKIRINNLFPVVSVADLEDDSLSVFRIVALDYDHNTRSMSVTPDNRRGSARLDVILQQSGIDVGQIIDRPAKPVTAAGGIVRTNNKVMR